MTHLPPVLQNLTERAEFYLTLGRAFLPPTSLDMRRALVEGLADDLEDLNAVLGLPLADDLAAFRAACAQTDAEAQNGGLLLAYSKVFLAPPIRVSLNGGFQMDGASMGDSTVRMEAWYLHHTLQRNPNFREMPDHLTTLLEFLALLLDKAASAEAGAKSGEGCSHRDDGLLEAAEWARQMLLSWVPGLADQIIACDRADSALPAHPYHALARLLAHALEADFQAPVVEEAPQVAEDTPPTGEAALCIKCGAYICEAEELAAVEAILTEKGLPTAHLYICSDCRDGSQGYTHQPIPGVDKATTRRVPFQGGRD